MLEVAKLCLGAIGDTKGARRLLAKVVSSKKVTLDTQEEALRLQKELQTGRA